MNILSIISIRRSHLTTKKKKTSYHPAKLTLKQINMMFDRFAYPLIQLCTTPHDKECAHAVSVILWISFITVTDSKDELYNKLESSFEHDQNSNHNIISLYLSQMKTSLTASETKGLRRYFSDPLNLNRLLHSYLKEIEASDAQNSLVKAEPILTEIQIQEMYDRFSAPILRTAHTPQRKEGALAISKILWFRLVTKTDSEKYILKDFKAALENDIEANKIILTLYLKHMKTALTDTEIISLQKHYEGIKNISQLMDTHHELPLRHDEPSFIQ